MKLRRSDWLQFVPNCPLVQRARGLFIGTMVPLFWRKCTHLFVLAQQKLEHPKCEAAQIIPQNVIALGRSQWLRAAHQADSTRGL